ncbi:MAG: tRNA (adenosine(37)-N6)-dimethylallyltransferase MiaA [Planctomycetia bacterium]|nr:tRNA (adenosine(37)-N6)-dimethylallyltransferase MiaA [Planctomycetia bacterium]
MTTYFAENCYFLTGPTACGKTALALEFAEKENAEILSMDSVAIYREMDIGSAKPTREEQALAVHHLIDLVNPDEEFSVAEYLRHAETVARDCLARGKKPLFVGGTPLYMKSLIFGLFQGPEGDTQLREKFQKEGQSAAEMGDMEFLHRKLMEIDPVTAGRLHPNDTRRIIRALEVYELTGKPIHEFQTQFQPEVPDELRDRIRIIDIPRPDLHYRIEARVDRMFELGFLEEVRGLRKKYPTLSRTASMAVGYRETLAWLDAEERGEKPSFDALVTDIKTHTRQMAKRQVTWFRSLMNQEFMF